MAKRHEDGLSRKYLEGMGLTEGQVTAIIEQHTMVTGRMQEEIDAHEEDAQKIKDLESKLKAYEGGKDWKAEHDKLKGEFDTYKQQVADKAADDAKLREVRRLGKEAGLSDAGIEKAAKYTDRKGMELGEDGKAKDAAAIVKALREEWPEYIVKTARKGVQPATPPGDGKVSRTREEIMAIKDTAERQQAIAENMELFK